MSERGSVLLLGLIITMMILLFTVGAISTSVSLGKEAKHQLDQTRALAAAEGVTESAQSSILQLVANFEPIPSSGTIALGGVSHPYTVTPVSSPFTETDPDGITRTIQHYRVSSSVNTGDGFATVDRIIDLSMTPIFQYMIFYDDDLEILPGPTMTLGGRVHANADIYIGCGNTLKVDTDYLRCTGRILRKRKNDNSEATGTVDIKVSGESTYVAMDNLHDAEYADWTSYALDTWKGTVQDGSHGVTEVAAPEIGTIKAYEPDGTTKGYYHSQADLVIRDNLAYDNSGNPLALPAGVLLEKTMYDGREGKTITVTEVNVALLNASGKFPANGLIYAYRTDATTSQPNGIRLANGSMLLRPLTVVSQDPVYVRGDFNTVAKKGAAVLSDAVNLLSNGWNDTKTSGALPAALETNFNLAFVSGNVRTPDGGGNYSGGFENLPRFHENWSGTTCRIRGSFVNLFESEIGKAPWVYGSPVYTAPNRDWAYDPDLINSPPPFTPNAIYFRRVLWDDRLALPF